MAEAARAAGAEVIVAGRETVDITDDASIAVLFCLTNTILTGQTLQVDGAEALV